MDLDYQVNDVPKFHRLIIYGVQWAVITFPVLIILGNILSDLHFDSISDQILYLQKLFFITASGFLLQSLLGHKYPIIPGPAAVLLIGIMASLGYSIDIIYTSIMIGGVFIVVLTATGLFRYLQSLFTLRVVAVILLLIAFTLTPTIIKLLTLSHFGGNSSLGVGFFFLTIFLTFTLYRLLKGIYQATLILWVIILGSVIYYLILPEEFDNNSFNDIPLLASFFKDFTIDLSFNWGVILSFVFCYIALVINDFASIESLNKLLNPGDEEKRMKRGVLVTGFSNILAGFFGVIGPVNFSLSPGIILSIRCASRFPFIPAALILGAISFMPYLIQIINHIPAFINGIMLVYFLSTQLAAGLIMAFSSTQNKVFTLESGIIIGFPVLIATIFSFLPAELTAQFPSLLQSILGNGFVVGVVCVLIMEHLVFKKKQ